MAGLRVKVTPPRAGLVVKAYCALSVAIGACGRCSENVLDRVEVECGRDRESVTTHLLQTVDQDVSGSHPKPNTVKPNCAQLMETGEILEHGVDVRCHVGEALRHDLEHAATPHLLMVVNSVPEVPLKSRSATTKVVP